VGGRKIDGAVGAEGLPVCVAVTAGATAWTLGIMETGTLGAVPEIAGGAGATGTSGATDPGAAVGKGAPTVTGGGTYGPCPFCARKRSCFSQYCCKYSKSVKPTRITNSSYPYLPRPFIETVVKVVQQINCFVPPWVVLQRVYVDIEGRNVPQEP
jgi:hypothetical protein